MCWKVIADFFCGCSCQAEFIRCPGSKEPCPDSTIREEEFLPGREGLRGGNHEDCLQHSMQWRGKRPAIAENLDMTAFQAGRMPEEWKRVGAGQWVVRLKAGRASKEEYSGVYRGRLPCEHYNLNFDNPWVVN